MASLSGSLKKARGDAARARVDAVSFAAYVIAPAGRADGFRDRIASQDATTAFGPAAWLARTFEVTQPPLNDSFGTDDGQTMRRSRPESHPGDVCGRKYANNKCGILRLGFVLVWRDAARCAAALRFLYMHEK